MALLLPVDEQVQGYSTSSLQTACDPLGTHPVPAYPVAPAVIASGVSGLPFPLLASSFWACPGGVV